MNRLLIALAVACVGLGGCKATPSQRYGAAAIAYSATLNVISDNSDLLSDGQLESVSTFATPGKQYLDRVYEVLTDGDPTNDGGADALLWTLENEILPPLVRVRAEVKP